MQSERGMILLLVGLIGVLTLMMMSQNPWSGDKKQAPEARLQLDPNGPPVTISSLRGSVVVLDMWATWCGPCRMSMPELEKLHQKYRGKDVKVIGVACDDESTQERIPALKTALGITYPTVIGLKTPDLLKNYDSGNLPTLYVIDKQGNVRLEEKGFDNEGKLSRVDELIKTLLEE